MAEHKTSTMFGLCQLTKCS